MDIIDVEQDWKDETRRELEEEAGRLKAKQERIDHYLKALDKADEQEKTIEALQQEIEGLRQQLQEKEERNQTLEMRLSEMTKLSNGVAKKSSYEELVKALTTFVKRSKQKRLEKRTAVKEMVLELANANGIVFPEELAAMIDSLDDEQVFLSALPAGAEQQELVDKLKPIFFGEATEARAFLQSIAGMKPTQITDRVNQLAKEHKISEMSKHRDLWRVLHDAGLYDKSESNWNAQVE